MKAIAKLLWYGAAVALPLLLQSTFAGVWLFPHANAAFYLGMSFFITAIQVGQSAAFQATLAKGVTYGIPPVATTACAVSGSVLGMLALKSSTTMVLGIPLIFSIGLLVGASFSLENAHLLARAGGKSYFRRMCLRNIFIFAACISAVHFSTFPGLEAIVAASVCILIFLALRPAAKAMTSTKRQVRSLKPAEMRALLLGIASSSIYRNDQNLVRAFSASGAAFGLLHNALLAAAAVQAAAGALLATLVLPKIERPDQLEPWSRKLDKPSFAIMLIAGAVGLCLEDAAPKIVCASLILAGNQWWAYRLHIREKSVHVYGVGIAAFLILAGLLQSGVSADLAYLLFAFSTSTGVQLTRLLNR